MTGTKNLTCSWVMSYNILYVLFSFIHILFSVNTLVCYLTLVYNTTNVLGSCFCLYNSKKV